MVIIHLSLNLIFLLAEGEINYKNLGNDSI